MTGKPLEQLQKLPLNQESEKLLKKVGEKLDPSYLAVFQLMQWGLRQGLSPVNDDQDFEDLVERLSYNPNQEESFNYLTKNWQGEKDLDGEDLKLQPNPERAAMRLLEQLKLKVKSDPQLHRLLP